MGVLDLLCLGAGVLAVAVGPLAVHVAVGRRLQEVQEATTGPSFVRIFLQCWRPATLMVMVVMVVMVVVVVMEMAL